MSEIDRCGKPLTLSFEPKLRLHDAMIDEKET